MVSVHNSTKRKLFLSLETLSIILLRDLFLCINALTLKIESIYMFL